MLIKNPEVVQVGLEAVLGSQAGVHQEAPLMIPFLETPVVEQLQVILDDKGDDVMLQTLLKKDQTAHTAISILEGMNPFKGYMM